MCVLHKHVLPSFRPVKWNVYYWERGSSFKNIQYLYLIVLIWGEGLRQCKEFTPFQLNYTDEVLEAVNW